MSEIPLSANDNGVVQAVIGIAVGVILIGLAISLWRGRASTDAALIAFGMGGLLTLGMLYLFVSRLRDIETRNPVTIVRGDLNDRDRIRSELVKLFLFVGVAVVGYEFVLVSPSNEHISLATMASEYPLWFAGLVGLFVFFVLGILFLPRSRDPGGV